MQIGIVGGGQLARMLAQAARRLNIDSIILDPNPECSASHVTRQIIGPYDDPASLRQLAIHCDVVTYEFENVPVEPLRTLADLIPVRPSIDALAASQDRLSEKSLFRELDIDTPRFGAVDSPESLKLAIDEIGCPGVLKTRRLGYDGKGQFVIRGKGDLEAAWAAVNGRPSILEAFLEFDRELSIIAARGLDGSVAIYPLTQSSHQNGILRETVTPAPDLPGEVVEAARRYVTAILTRFDYVGVIALELFDCGGRLLANEYAPRVHNTGHWSIEGAACSQFENHVRAVLGLPLGETTCARPTGMVNLIGSAPTAENFVSAKDAIVHFYDKSPRPGRKIGHVTTIAETYEALELSMVNLRSLINRD